MITHNRFAALLAVVALAAAACGASTANIGEAEDDATDADAAVEVVSLGEREAGFGPGSLAVRAGSIAGRIWDVEGNWFVGEPFTPIEIPEVCGFAESLALQGTSLSRVDPELSPFGDAMRTQVQVYETPEEAASHVELLNGPNADVCDAANLEVAVNMDVMPPGVELDAGDGVGVPIEAPAGPDGQPMAARLYSAELRIGSVTQELDQIETWVSSGRYLIQATASSAVGSVDAVNDALLEALFGEPLPDIVGGTEFDAAINTIRAAVLSDDALPEFFEPAGTLTVFQPSPSDDSCYTEARPDARASGPAWLAISPGVGGSEVLQRADFYLDESVAEAAFAEFLDLGADCLADTVDLPEPFRLVGSAFETLETDGRTVALVKLDYVQLVGTQEFDIELGTAVVLEGPFALSVDFFGLAGDSPDLAELVLQAVEEVAE